jgi:hypothetical protein
VSVSPSARWYGTVIRVAATSSVDWYAHIAYRIRGWGKLPRTRGATLVIANHQHDLDSMAVMARLTLEGPWTTPVRTVSSRRMFEPGFFAVRTPWIAPLVRRVDASPLFDALGPMPIENDLRRRTLRAIATSVRRRHGNAPLADVLSDGELARLGLQATLRVDDLGAARWFDGAETAIDMRTLREPHRSEIIAETRALIATDLARIEDALRAGGTMFVTPEGHYTLDGRMLRFRAVFERLVPLAEVWLSPISYDALRGTRLSQLYRLLRPAKPDDILASLKAARPVTVSQLLAAWLLGPRPTTFLRADAVTGVATGLQGLPRGAFLDPELAAAPPRVVQEALDTCERLGILIRDGAAYRLSARRTHPRFADVDDIVAFQARFLEETLDGLARISA